MVQHTRAIYLAPDTTVVDLHGLGRVNFAHVAAESFDLLFIDEMTSASMRNTRQHNTRLRTAKAKPTGTLALHCE